ASGRRRAGSAACGALPFPRNPQRRRAMLSSAHPPGRRFRWPILPAGVVGRNETRTLDFSTKLKFRLQPADERREAGLPFALEPLGGKDRANVVEGAVEIAVDHDVIVLGPVAHLVACFRHAGADGFLVVLGTGVQTPRQLAARRRQQEYAHEIVAGALAQ